MQSSSSAVHYFSGIHAHTQAHMHTNTDTANSKYHQFLFWAPPFMGAIACPAGRWPGWHSQSRPMPVPEQWTWKARTPQVTPAPQTNHRSRWWSHGSPIKVHLYLLKSLWMKCLSIGFSFPEYSKMKEIPQINKISERATAWFLLKWIIKWIKTKVRCFKEKMQTTNKPQTSNGVRDPWPSLLLIDH